MALRNVVAVARLGASRQARLLSTATSREYDLVLFGATGFSGRLSAEYALRAHGDKGLRIAVAGRDHGKLEALVAELGGLGLPATPHILVADASSPEDCARVAEAARVVASTAGPFREYGSELFGACARAGTHYADITGEARWIDWMRHEHGAAAEASGAVLVPGSGFDSVPSDVGALLAVRHFEGVHGSAPARVDAYVTRIKSGFQGGTAATIVGEMAAPTPAAPREALAYRTKIDWGRGSPTGTVRIGGVTRYLSPFIMAGANCPVVRRSNGLVGYADGLVYSESMALPTRGAALKNAAMLGLGGAALRFGPTRALLAGKLPKPGEGPSRERMARGKYEIAFVAASADASATTTTTWTGRSDPSSIQTSIFLVETALGLLDADGTATAGVRTPAAALGEALWARLEVAVWDKADDPAPAVTVTHATE